MVMSWVFFTILLISAIFSLFTDNSLGGAAIQGAQAGITLAISLAGSLCLWTGVGHLMEKIGLTDRLSRLLRPLLRRLFPSSEKDPRLGNALSANLCANLLGLGNAATPMGIRAARRLAGGNASAGPELCRLIVLNTASIQLIPANVAALRSGLGCASPFDILPAVWVSSLCSAGLGILAAWMLEKVWRRD